VAQERVQLRAVPRPQLEGTQAVAEPDPAAFERAGWFPAAAAVLRPAPTLDGMERVVMRVNPLAFEAISGRLLVRPRIRIGFSCAVRNHGRYDEDSVDLLSPVLRGVLGSRQLMTSFKSTRARKRRHSMKVPTNLRCRKKVAGSGFRPKASA